MRPGAVLLLPLMLLVPRAGAAPHSGAGTPGVVDVAVAANFLGVQQELARRFTRDTGFQVRTSVGSTGQLYAQIANGAPFDIFLAADTVRPVRLERAGLTVVGSRFVYARGRLVLYAPGLDSVRAGGEDLRSGGYEHVAIANPRTAPYGAAAEQVLARLGLTQRVTPHLVIAENVAQAYQFVESGAAELGFVALSQVIHARPSTYWIVPATDHAPIRQDAVLLKHGADNAGARRYLAFLEGSVARGVIRSYGYDVGP
jgi:molybdate transport system substrate-binding protein